VVDLVCLNQTRSGLVSIMSNHNNEFDERSLASETTYIDKYLTKHKPFLAS